jgi:hypothetical protein
LVLVFLADPDSQAHMTAFVQSVQQLGWTESRNIRFDYRLAEQMVAERVIPSSGAVNLTLLSRVTRTIPIVHTARGC